jgi:regulator of sirC expression with transglutaminase-like and TPR domain
MDHLTFAELAAEDAPRLDLLALALAAEFVAVDADAALTTLDELGAELAARWSPEPLAQVRALASLLGDVHGFTGDSDHYDHPDNSMLDRVLARRRGLPILLSVVYVEVARRASIPLAGVGLPGHFVAGRFDGDAEPILLDPFSGGALTRADDPALVRPWTAHEIAMRMLNNLVVAYHRRGNLSAAITAAELRLTLPADDALRSTLVGEHRALTARLN